MAKQASRPRSVWVKLLTVLLAAVAAWLGKGAVQEKGSGSAPRTSAPAQAEAKTDPGTKTKPDMQALLTAAQGQRSGVWVEGEGRVVKVLADDVDGVPHQRFLITVEGLPNQTIKISNNLDLGERVPVEKGDTVAFSGQFEWNPDLGGAVHWTHDDPAGKHKEGWIRLDGKLYQ